MIKKRRQKIPDEIATEILFLNDRTCCVCNERGKNIQIHHIDEDRRNNKIENLSVLCLECHNDTMIKGGFGRKLDASQVIKYKTEWIERVKKRKEKADEIASIQSVTGSMQNLAVEKIENDEYKTYNDPSLLKEYLTKILIIHKAQLQIAQTKWDTGITVKMNQGNYDMVDFYQEVLIELSKFYPKGHFDKKVPKVYFNEIISNRFSLHRYILEPDGIGNNGTIMSTITGGNVIEDLKQMILNMVNALSFSQKNENEFNLKKWKKEWLI